MPDTLERVLTDVQRLLQSGAGGDGLSAGLAPLLSRAGRLGPADAHSTYLTVGSLLASLCAPQVMRFIV